MDKVQNMVIFASESRDTFDLSHCSVPGPVPQQFTRNAQIKNCLIAQVNIACFIS